MEPDDAARLWRIDHGHQCRRLHANHDVTLFVLLRLLEEAQDNMNIVRSVLAFVVLSCLNLSAQQITGNIRGAVTDPSGAVMRGATVTARQAETGLSRSTTTDRNGNYVLLELPVGHYRLQVAAKGFQEYVQDGITLNVNETASVSPRLAVGSEKEQVEVTADAALIEPTVTSMGKVVEQRELEDLPLNGRNFSQLGLLQPGVVPLTPGIAEAGGSLRNGQGYAVNGQRPESNNFLIDGANNFNGIDGGFVLKPPVDAIAEFRIITLNANAEFGNALGSTTTMGVPAQRRGGCQQLFCANEGAIEAKPVWRRGRCADHKG
jgi:hypothetical protein